MTPSRLKIISESTNKRFSTGVETSWEKCFNITPNQSLFNLQYITDDFSRNYLIFNNYWMRFSKIS